MRENSGQERRHKKNRIDIGHRQFGKRIKVKGLRRGEEQPAGQVQFRVFRFQQGFDAAEFGRENQENDSRNGGIGQRDMKGR